MVWRSPAFFGLSLLPRKTLHWVHSSFLATTTADGGMDGLPLLIVWLYLSLLCGYLSLQLDHRSETVLLLSGRILTISITGSHMGLCQNLASNSKKILGPSLLRNLASVAWLSSRMTVMKFFLKESPQKGGLWEIILLEIENLFVS